MSAKTHDHGTPSTPNAHMYTGQHSPQAGGCTRCAVKELCKHAVKLECISRR